MRIFLTLRSPAKDYYQQGTIIGSYYSYIFMLLPNEIILLNL